MAENQDGQEKSQEPTAKRLADARKKGQVPRSRELNTTAVTLVGLATIVLLTPRFTAGFHTLFVEQFSLERRDMFDPDAMMNHLVGAVGDALLMLMPYFAVMMVVAVLASVALGGFNLSAQALQPKFSKMDPVKGIKRIFSAKGLMELVKSLGKFVLVAVATVAVLNAWSEDLIRLSSLEVDRAIVEGMGMIAWASIIISVLRSSAISTTGSVGSFRRKDRTNSAPLAQLSSLLMTTAENSRSISAAA